MTTSVRLAVAVADAMPHPAGAHPDPVLPQPEASAQPVAPAPSPTTASAVVAAATSPTAEPAAPIQHPSSRSRTGLSGWLRRPAEYLRAYLTASVEHQLAMQAERTVLVVGAVTRLEAAAPLVEAGFAHAHELTRAHAEAQAHGQALRDVAVAERFAALDAHLARVSAELAAAVRRLALVEERGVATSQLLSEHERVRAAVAADQIALGRRNAAAGEHAVARLDEVLGVLGPRFDELEIKVRPLVEIDAESVAVRTADGYVMLPRSEPLFVTAVANATSGGLEPGVRRVLRALLRPGDACADVGANVGLLTAAMGFAVGPAGRVWAFEPEARVRAQLVRTLHLNGLAQVTLSGSAVGERPGRLTFHQSPIIGHSSLYALPDDEAAGERAVEVEVTTLDAVVPSGTPLVVVKIDVEGAELDVLAGMARVVADSPDLAVVAEFGPSHLRRVGLAPEAWFAAFAAHGLEPRLIAEPGGVVSPTSAAELAEVESANLVFVRPGGTADGRLPR